MPRLLLILLLLSLLFSNCRDPKANKLVDENAFYILNDSLAIRYIDSIAWTIDHSIPLRQKGQPLPKKGKYAYYGQRPFVNSSGELIKYSLYEYSSDTFQTFRNFYFYHNRLVKVDIWSSDSEKLTSMGKYYFRNGLFLDSSNINLRVPPQILKAQASHYLMNFNKGQ